MADQVRLKIDGTEHTGWTGIAIERGLNTLCSTFDLSLTERGPGIPERRKVANGEACELWVGEDIIVTGWVDVSRRRITADGRSISVSGRDKTGDLIDCSAIHKPGSWRNQKLERIAADLLKPFGLSLKTLSDTGAVFSHFALEQGETVFDALSRMARLRGLLLGTDSASNLILHRPAPRRVKTALKLGVNLLDIDVVDESGERFSQYIIKGQQQGGNWVDASDAAAVKGQASDPGMTRHRPLLLISDDQSTTAGLTARAKWEATARCARAQSVEVTVKGWRDEDGALWEPNTLVPVVAVEVDVEMELMVSNVRLAMDTSQVAVLTLVRPEAYTLEPLPEPTHKSKTAKKSRATDPLKDPS